jgi:hypothetical protein
MALKGQESKPLTVLNATGGSEPFYLRKIARSTPWLEALTSKDPSAACDFLLEPDGSVSLWFIPDDIALRRVAIAMNESRPSPRASITFLPILPSELISAGIALQQTPGATNCDPARGLHFDAHIDEDLSLKIVQTLLIAGRRPCTCTKGQMNKALDDAKNDGCFAAVQSSTGCACGSVRSVAK